MDLEHLAADISLEFLRQLPTNESAAISPLSILLSLGVIYAGTDGICRENINNAFFKNSTEFRTFAKQYLNIFEEPMYFEDIYLNTFIWPPGKKWMNRQWNDYMEKINKSFVAEIYHDYSAEILLRKERNLYKMMKKLQKNIGDGGRKVIKNLMGIYGDYGDGIGAGVFSFAHFTGMWRESFYEARWEGYKKEYFSPAVGEPKMMDFMSSKEGRLYYEADNFIFTSRPYFNEFFFNVLLPKENHTLESVLKNLSGKRLADCLDKVDFTASDTYIDFKIPKFQVDAKVNVVPLVKKLGIHPIFYPKLANFSRMAPAHAYIENIEHVTTFSNDDDGSDADNFIHRSGYTPMIFIPWEDPPTPVHLNRPFAFFITYRKEIMFAGNMNG